MTTRRGFLKSLGILAATACIPEHLEKAVEFVPEREREMWWQFGENGSIVEYEVKGHALGETKLAGVVFYDVHGNQMEFIRST